MSCQLTKLTNVVVPQQVVVQEAVLKQFVQSDRTE